MNQTLRTPLVSKAISLFCLMVLWSSLVLQLRAETWPTQWSFESLENSSSEWWQCLRVQTVPGVLYHLQKSETLEADSWTTEETTYGSGEEWICPLMQGIPPAASPPAGQTTIPPVPANPIRLAYLIMEKTDTGGVLVSWWSLDDHTSKRMVLPGVTLDPVWDEFDAPYFNQHGNFYFALCPNMHRTVNFTGSSPTLGALDSAMIAEFTSSLPTITENIANSVANAALYSHQPEPSGERKFYRIAADWSLDSDSDGRYDWQELVFDGNNPFAADTDGDGNNDVASDNSGPEPSLTNPPENPIDDPPLATIQQNLLSFSRSAYYGEETPSIQDSLLYPNAGAYGETSGFLSTRSFDAVAEAMAALPLREDNWADYVSEFACDHWTSEFDDDTSDLFAIRRVAYRLHLDRPAPEGGYSIPVRVMRFSMTRQTQASLLSDGPYSGIGYEDLNLTVAEGQTVGEPIYASYFSTPAKSRTSYNVLTLDMINNNLEGEEDYDYKSFKNGACVLPTDAILASMPGYASYSNQITVKWRKHRLSGDGSIGSPEELAPLTSLTERAQPEPPSDLHSRHFAYLKINDPGIYQFDAEINFPNGTKITAPYLRMKHAKGLIDSNDIPNPLLMAGKPDYIGVCPNEVSYRLRQDATEWIGRTEYAFAKKIQMNPNWTINPFTAGTHKCNIFLTHRANHVGATTPYFWEYAGMVPRAPLAHGDWHLNPEENIDLDGPGWHFLGVAVEPSPGMSVAGNGHCGLLDYDGTWINASTDNVNKAVHLSNQGGYNSPNFRTR